MFFYEYHLEDASFMMRTVSRIVNNIGTYMKLIFAVCTLLLFMTIKINHSAVINKIAGATFAVYLFHGSPFFISFFFKYLNIITAAYNTAAFPLIFCLTVIGIFAVSWMMDLCQKKVNPRVLGRLDKIWKKVFLCGEYENTGIESQEEMGSFQS